MRTVRLKTICGATRDIEVNDAPQQSSIDVPMYVGSRRGITFSASDSMPSLGDPPKIVTRTFEYYGQGYGELPVYRERYVGPSPDQQSYKRIVEAQNREIEQLKAQVRTLEKRLLPRVLRWFGMESWFNPTQRRAAMPFKSQKQREYMYANDPEMAKKWERDTPKNKKLPKQAPKPKKKSK